MEPPLKKLRQATDYTDEEIEREISDAWVRMNGETQVPFPSVWVEAARRQGEREPVELARKFYKAVAEPCLAQVRALVLNSGHYQTASPPQPKDMVFAIKYAAKPQVERVARVLKRAVRLRHDGLADSEIDTEIKKHVDKIKMSRADTKADDLAAASTLATPAAAGAPVAFNTASVGDTASLTESFHRTQTLLGTMKMGDELLKAGGGKNKEKDGYLASMLEKLREEATISFSHLASHFLEQSDAARENMRAMLFPEYSAGITVPAGAAPIAHTAAHAVAHTGAAVAAVPSPQAPQQLNAPLHPTEALADLTSDGDLMAFGPPTAKETPKDMNNNAIYNGAPI